MALSNIRIAEMLNDLEDYETSWTKFESDFITGTQQRMEDDGDDFKFVGKQEETFQNIYNKYVKEVDKNQY